MSRPNEVSYWQVQGTDDVLSESSDEVDEFGLPVKWEPVSPPAYEVWHAVQLEDRFENLYRHVRLVAVYVTETHEFGPARRG